MRIYVFAAAKGASFGFSPDETGSNLPAEYGPWAPFKSIDVNRREERGTAGIADVHRMGVDVAEMLESLENRGYHLID